MKFAVRILLIATVAVYILYFFFGWLLMNVDTSYFHAFADYIRTGTYKHFMLYEYKKPLTNTAPLYSLLLALLYTFQRSDIILRIIQLSMLGTTSYLIYKILKNATGVNLAATAACFHALIPGNLIFAMYTMSEIGIQFLLTLYTWLVYKSTVNKKIFLLPLISMLGFAMGLWKYPFLMLGPLALILQIYYKQIKLKQLIFPLAGISMIILWMFINRQITGVFALSDFQNLRYNMQIMWKAQVLPPEDHASVKELRSYLPAEFDLKQPFWVFEPYINPKTGNDYQELDRIVGSVGKAALLYHPDAFLKIFVYTFFKMHMADYPYQTPYPPSLTDFGLPNPRFEAIYCNNLSTMNYCQPIIDSPISKPVFRKIISVFNWYYAYIFPIFSVILFFPAFLYILLRDNAFVKIVAVIYLVSRIPIAAFTFPHARYLLPHYPLMVIIIAWAIKSIIDLIKKT